MFEIQVSNLSQFLTSPTHHPHIRFSLGAGQSPTFTVTYQPANCGDDTGSISTGTGCSNVSCSATGPDIPVCEVSTSTLNFSAHEIGDNDSQTFSITNTGCGTLSGSDVQTGHPSGNGRRGGSASGAPAYRRSRVDRAGAGSRESDFKKP